MQREFGRVKKWFDERGFGFIRCDDGNDYFAHVSQFGFLRPHEGDRVAFDSGANPRTGKPEAKNISILDGEAAHAPVQSRPDDEVIAVRSAGKN